MLVSLSTYATDISQVTEQWKIELSPIETKDNNRSEIVSNFLFSIAYANEKIASFVLFRVTAGKERKKRVSVILISS